MAYQDRIERYEHATIDCADQTITEYRNDAVRSYAIGEILKRWDGVPDVTITIERRREMPPTGER